MQYKTLREKSEHVRDRNIEAASVGALAGIAMICHGQSTHLGGIMNTP